METELQEIVSMVEQTFNRGAWHGPAVKEVLQDVTPEVALRKLPNTHSIIELVWHMTTWRTYVTKRLTGDYEFKVSGKMNFPENQNWDECLRKLDDSQTDLLAALRQFPASRLVEVVPNSKTPHTYYQLIHGIVQHDLYHTGQIMLIKKSNADANVLKACLTC